ncbi:hypothetical protein CPB86DRAFT_102398 [Serendipita vermifera]|nr:hypothetical protein CPB86DRAFT_102398 [Serendipita vermifera]
MLQVRRFLLKLKSLSILHSSTLSSNVSKLPNELLILIVSLVEETRDLCALCLVSRLLRSIAEDRLYRQIFTTSTPLRHGRRVPLCRTLLQRRFESIVTDLDITLGKWKSCSRWDASPISRHLRGRCTCDVVDKEWGRAIVSLTQLVSLQFTCYLCYDSQMDRRHRYLQNLKTKNLKRSAYSCFCSISDGKRELSILAAPYMRSVTILDWRCDSWTQVWRPEFDAFLDNPDILPNIRWLNYDNTPFSSLLVSKRYITRLSTRWPPGKIPLRYSLLSQFPGRPTHLSDHDQGSDLLRFSIIREPGPFRSLQHFGKLEFRQLAPMR